MILYRTEFKVEYVIKKFHLTVLLAESSFKR
jgi:hypothetical protein